MSVASYALARPRARTPRAKELRAYVATFDSGVLTPGRGAWLKIVGGDERRFDATLRLSRNIGDRLIVTWGSDWRNVAAVEITKIGGSNWKEAWTVRVLEGDEPANGPVMVMASRRAA